MQQSSVIFANLIIAYLFFIVFRGELADYITLLRGGGKQSGGSSGASGSGSTGNAVVDGAESLLNDNPFDTSFPSSSFDSLADF